MMLSSGWKPQDHCAHDIIVKLPHAVYRQANERLDLAKYANLLRPSDTYKQGLVQHWYWSWLVTCSALGNNQNQWLLSVIWTTEANSNEFSIDKSPFCSKAMQLKKSGLQHNDDFVHASVC